MINEYKKLRLTLLEYKPRGLMAENKNVYKTIRLEIYVVYYDKILYMCECGRVVLSRMSVLTLNANVLASNIGISKRTRYSHIVFLSHPLYFLLCTFTLYFPCFAFLLLIALETLLVKQFTLKFTLKEVLLKCRQTN